MEQELMAFWKYDQYPYCLWGIIDKFKDDKVCIKTYQGYFRPFLVVEKECGLRLSSKLIDLKFQRNKEWEELKNKFEEELDTIIKIPGVNT